MCAEWTVEVELAFHSSPDAVWSGAGSVLDPARSHSVYGDGDPHAVSSPHPSGKDFPSS